MMNYQKMTVFLVGVIAASFFAVMPAMAQLTFYTDQPTFEAAAPGLPVEDFEGSNVPPASVLACAGPFNSATNNACFSPGALIDGFSLDNDSGGVNLNVVLTAGFVGVTSTVAGPNTFADNTVLTFTGGNVTAVGMDLLSPFAASVVDIEVFGPGGVSLGTTTTTTGTTTGAFWGVTSTQVITGITITEQVATGDLLDNLQFGAALTVDVPTMTEWGMMIFMLLAGLGALYNLRRKGSEV